MAPWLWLLGYGSLGMTPWVWLLGYGSLAMAPWLWLPGYGSLAMAPWLWLLGYGSRPAAQKNSQGVKNYEISSSKIFISLCFSVHITGIQ